MSKPPTIKDVAGALGMHKSTVSLALSGKGTISSETRQRVLSVARELGYVPNPHAQGLAQKQHSTTVSLFSGVLDVGLATEKILLVQGALNARAFEAPLYTSAFAGGDRGEKQAVQMRQICRLRPRAIVCAMQRVHPAVFRELQAYQRMGGVVISYDIPIEMACDQVIFDREDNAYRAAKYLLERGHRRIGLGMSEVAGSGFVPQKPSEAQSIRLRGFQRALREYDLELRPEWFFHTSTYEKGGAEMARQFLQLAHRPTALAIVNDYVALAFMVEVMRAGVRIPQDLSLIGHDNQPIAAYCPIPLTSMTQPVDQIAQAVINRLVTCMENVSAADTAPRTIIIRGELIERNSVAPRQEEGNAND